MEARSGGTQTSSFGVGRREGHDASEFYARFIPPALSDDDTINRPPELIEELGSGSAFIGDSTDMHHLPDNSVALVVTSPPYFVGKEYELAVAGGGDADATIPSTYIDFLEMLRSVFAECVRVLEPGGRIAVNVANLGRKPYRSLSADIISILQDDLGLLLRGEIIWEKAGASSGSCAWGSFAKASNPVMRDLTERIIVASKGRFDRARKAKRRAREGLPYRSSLTNDEFLDVTTDVWRVDAESAKRVGHPAPFPVDLPRRLIDLYTYEDDIVVDPFLGSGSTLVAAARTGRIGVGYDLDPDYVALAKERLTEEIERRHAAEQQVEGAEALTVIDRHEQAYALALEAGQKVHDIAHARLEAAGFVSIREKVKHSAKLVTFDFVAEDATGRSWSVIIAGTFTSTRPGLTRTEDVWRLAGQLHAVVDNDPTERHRVLVLSPALPEPRTEAGRVLRSLPPAVLHDAVELFDPSGFERLCTYARGAPACE